MKLNARTAKSLSLLPARKKKYRYILQQIGVYHVARRERKFRKIYGVKTNKSLDENEK